MVDRPPDASLTHRLQAVGMSLQLADNLSLTVFKIPQTTTATTTSKLAAC